MARATSQRTVNNPRFFQLLGFSWLAVMRSLPTHKGPPTSFPTDALTHTRVFLMQAFSKPEPRDSRPPNN